MQNTPYHYTECGLKNVYLLNGFNTIETPQGKAVSIHDIFGLHRAIGILIITTQKDLTGDEIGDFLGMKC